MKVYFDNAATTALDTEVAETMHQAMLHLYGNPSSIHGIGRQSRAAIEEARKKIANCTGASIGEIFFTSGGTESNNMVLKNAVRDLSVERIVTSKLEHHAVLHTLETLAHQNLVHVEFVKIDSLGRIDTDDLIEKLQSSSKKTLVSLMHSNNEIGTMINFAEISHICVQNKALFHSDTVQTMGFYHINVNETPISFLIGAAHKFHGPKGVGFVYINNKNQIKPFIDGGSQERNMRGGTENLYGIIGSAHALEKAYHNLEARSAHIIDLKTYFKSQLLTNFKGISFVGDAENGHYKVLNVAFPKTSKSDLLLFLLDISGIAASGGSACSSGIDAGSHVLAAMNIPDDYRCVRFSFSHYNTRAEINYTIGILKSNLPELLIHAEPEIKNHVPI